MANTEFAIFALLLVLGVASGFPRMDSKSDANITVNLAQDISSINSSVISPTQNLTTLVKNDQTQEKKPRLLGLLDGPGGYGYGGFGTFGLYGSVPFPCPTVRLASLGFPYYNPTCYGYNVPSFPYYGGPLG